MKKWIARLFLYGVPLAMIIKGMLSTGSMTDIVLLLIGFSWLGVTITSKVQSTRGGLSATTRADIEFKNSQAEMRGGFVSGKAYGDNSDQQ